VVRLIEEVRSAQLERVLQGSFGVAATAKAAAPEVMAHVAELAGGVRTRRRASARGERGEMPMRSGLPSWQSPSPAARWSVQRRRTSTRRSRSLAIRSWMERIDPESEALYRKVAHECVAAILGDEASAEVFVLALDGLLADQPSMEVLEQRTQLLAARFAPG